MYLNSYTQIRDRGGTMCPPPRPNRVKSSLPQAILTSVHILPSLLPPKTGNAKIDWWEALQLEKLRKRFRPSDFKITSSRKTKSITIIALILFVHIFILYLQLTESEMHITQVGNHAGGLVFLIHNRNCLCLQNSYVLFLLFFWKRHSLPQKIPL